MIRLTIRVTDIENVMMLYSYIRIYRSDERDGTYSHLAFVMLVPGQSEYIYDDITGTPDYWYRSSYYRDENTESALSDPAQGTAPTLYTGATYPNEIDFDTSQSTIIRKIRRYIGDFKGLSRIYLENCEDESCNYISEDNKTLKLDEKGWPVYISLRSLSDGTTTDKTDLTDPTVQGYQYLTFSGTLISGTQCLYDIINVWYYTFKYSDREIYEAYGDAMIPPNVPTDSVTQDHLILQASIDLLENMTSEDMTEDGATIRDDQSLYDPSPGLRERDKTIGRLKDMLDALIDESIKNAIIAQAGVLID
jgi:hypothetical protein